MPAWWARVAALAMILGANLGSAVNPLIDAVSAGPAALRLPVGNLINRLVGCALALPFLPELATMIGHWEERPAAIDQRLLALRDRTLLTPHLGSAVVTVRRRNNKNLRSNRR